MKPLPLFKQVSQKASRGTCDECGAKVPELMGCPDGAEICRDCFDQGAH